VQQATSSLAKFANGQLHQNNEAVTDSSGICKYQVDEASVRHYSFNGQENHQMLEVVAVAFTIVSCATFDT
jgi:hypothetical protein